MKSFKICNNNNRITERYGKSDILNDILSKSRANKNSVFLFDGKNWCSSKIDNIIEDILNKNQKVGPRGQRGVDGPKGEEGSIGPRGPRGYKGEEGSTGPTGPLGSIGPTGPKGDSSINFGNNIDKNTIIGLETQNSGYLNTFIGYGSGKKENSNENVYVGHNAGTINSGGMNTFLGSETGKFSSGTQNTYIGNNSCAYTGSIGSYNLFAGTESGFHNTSGFGNVFLGTVSGASNKEGSWNVFIGQSSGHGNDDGNNNIFIGANSGISNNNGSGNICIGDSSDTSSENPTNQIVIGQGVVSYGDNTITFPNNLKSFPNGVEVNFSHTNGGCLYPVSSSVRWKNDIQDISKNIDTSLLYQLRPVTYKSTLDNDEKHTHIGFIAEEVEKLFPNLVPKDDLGRPSSVRYSLVSVLVVEELKKLKEKIEKELLEVKNKLENI